MKNENEILNINGPEIDIHGNHIFTDPLPEDDVVCHGVRLHLALHFNVKYL